MCRIGRPTVLTVAEEQHLVAAIRYLRQKGACVDRDIVVQLAEKTVSFVRGIPSRIALAKYEDVSVIFG